MPSAIILDSRFSTMQVESPRSPLDCQVLSLHLPHPSNGEPSRSKTSHYSSSMSSSSSYGHSPQHHQRPGTGQQYLTGAARLSSGSSGLGPTNHYSRSSNSHLLSEPPGDAHSRATLRHGAEETANDDTSSATQESPSSSHLTMGSPGVARRAKAHVPSACVNCKRKHLACETRRPCNRCLQAGKEATCIDVQHKKRGRPRLRDEETGRSGNYSAEYSHPQLYPASDMHALQGSDARAQPRTLSYREIRSHPDAMYGQSSTPSYPPLQPLHDTSTVAPLPTLPETTPIALLSLDLVVLRSNYAFSDALSLHPNTEGRSLMDLVIASEREKLQRLQNSLRAELNDTTHLPPLRSTPPRHQSFDLTSTAGFHPRSEYWTFRLPGEQSRGFPISISLARTTTYFLVLTLVASATPAPVLPSSGSASSWISSMPSTALPPPLQSPTSSSPYQTNPAYHSYHTKPVASDGRQHLLQPARGHDLTQYRQNSPQNESTTSPTVGSARGSLYEEDSRDRLGHLRLPPIRTSGIDQGGKEKGKGSSAKGSPQSGKRKKRRVVDIGDMLR